MNVLKAAKIYAKEINADTLILDTAGRLHIDEDLIKESFNLANYSKEKLTSFMEKWSDGDSNVL